MNTVSLNAISCDITFPSAGATIHGHLFLPEQRPSDQPLAAVIVVGPWTQVKEQTADMYARYLAQRGLAALSFDARFWGESDGEPRQYESSRAKEEDIRSAITFLQSRPEIDGDRIGGLGICFGAGYMAEAVNGDDRLRAFATVAAWIHDHDSLEAMFGAEEVARRLRVGAEAQQRFEQTGEVDYVPAYAPGDNPAAAMNFEGGYYASSDRGVIPAWTNRFAVLSWPEWINLDGVAAASEVRVPTLFVHSDGSALPDNVRRAYAALRAPKALFWTDGNHFDFYDQEPYVSRAANIIAAHFAEHLHARLEVRGIESVGQEQR
jgi:uncharacterized protein